MLSKNTILKAIHNADDANGTGTELRMLSKNTILKAIHNWYRLVSPKAVTANAK